MIHIVGAVGTVLVLSAYLLLSADKLRADSYHYQGTNLAGAIALTAYSAVLGAWAAVPLNAAWAIIAVVALVRIGLRRRSPG